MSAVASATLFRRGSLSGELVLNVGSQLLLRVATALTALYAARVLGPAQFGMWAVLQVLFLYTAQGHCGTVNAMMREVPLARARGNAESAQQLVNSTWGFVTASSVLVAVLSGAVVWWLRGPVEQARWGLVVIGSAVMVIVQLQSVFFQFYCRAFSSFAVLAMFNVGQALITIALSYWLIPRLGIAGYLFALSAGFSIIVVAVTTRPGLKIGFSLTNWSRLLRIGLPMLPGTLMLYLNMSLERVMLAATISAAAAGIFAAGPFFFQVGGTLWELVIYTWYARLAELYAATGRVESLAEALGNVIPGAVWISSSIQGAMFIALPFGLAKVLPEYTRSIAIAQMLVVSVNIWGIAQLLNFALTIVQRQKHSLGLQGLFLAVKIALLAMAVSRFKDPFAAAAASVLALLFYGVSTWWWWKRTVGVSCGSLSQVSLLWAGPAAIAGACCWRLTPDARETAVRLMVYVVAVGAASVLLQTQAGVLGRMWRRTA